MKFTAIRKFFTVFFLLLIVLSLLPSGLYAQDGVGVNAEVVLLDEQEAAIIEISQMLAKPNPVRVGYIIKLIVTLKGYDGMLLPFHSVYLEADGPGTFTLTQPEGLTGYDGVAIGYITSDVAGVYNVTATDTTYIERDIKIKASEDAIFIAEGIPILYTEPEYTKGYSNTLDWDPLPNIIQYYIEASEDEAFSEIAFSAGWMSDTQYEFTGLQSGTKYYYRVRGRNEAGANTLWSNIVFSTQDASPPESEVVDVEKVQNGFKVTVEATDEVGEVALVDIFVKMDDGEWVWIKSTELDDVTIEFSEIEGFDVENKPERICFYSRAEDTVGNLENFDPKDTGDYCVGYGITFQNVVDLINRLAETGVVTTNNFFNSGVTWVADIIVQNPALFIILLFLPLVIYIIIWMYKNHFKLSEIGMWLELLNYKLFPWLLADEGNRPIGVVFDSGTREPIKNVVVSLIKKDEVKQVSITDKTGVFRFSPEDFKYEINCWKSGYEFPSKIFKKSKDEVFNIIYQGGSVALTKDKKKLIGIPVDNLKEQYENVWYWTLDFFMDILRFINPLLMVAAIGISFILNILFETNIYYIFVILYLLLLADTLGFLNTNRKSWGLAKDEEGKRIKGAKIGIYNEKFDKLVDIRVTNDKGRFRFVVPSGEYLVKPAGKKYEVAGGEDGVRIKYTKGKMIEVSPTIILTKL